MRARAQAKAKARAEAAAARARAERAMRDNDDDDEVHSFEEGGTEVLRVEGSREGDSMELLDVDDTSSEDDLYNFVSRPGPPRSRPPRSPAPALAAIPHENR